MEKSREVVAASRDGASSPGERDISRNPPAVGLRRVASISPTSGRPPFFFAGMRLAASTVKENDGRLKSGNIEFQLAGSRLPDFRRSEEIEGPLCSRRWSGGRVPFIRGSLAFLTDATTSSSSLLRSRCAAYGSSIMRNCSTTQRIKKAKRP